MLLSSILMIILYLVLKYVLAWIRYFNSLDSRLGQSTWRWSYDYPVVGERDISDLDDKTFVRLRRKRNRVITLMYSILLIMFLLSMSLLSEFLIFFLTYFLVIDPFSLVSPRTNPSTPKSLSLIMSLIITLISLLE